MSGQTFRHVGETEFVRRAGLYGVAHCPSCHEDESMGEPIIELYGDWDDSEFLGPDEMVSICCEVQRAHEGRAR